MSTLSSRQLVLVAAIAILLVLATLSAITDWKLLTPGWEEPALGDGPAVAQPASGACACEELRAPMPYDEWYSPLTRQRAASLAVDDIFPTSRKYHSVRKVPRPVYTPSELEEGKARWGIDNRRGDAPSSINTLHGNDLFRDVDPSTLARCAVPAAPPVFGGVLKALLDCLEPGVRLDAPRAVFIMYTHGGDPTPTGEWRERAAAALRDQVAALTWKGTRRRLVADEDIHHIHEADLPAWYRGHMAHLARYGRGAGYWYWKPAAIRMVMERYPVSPDVVLFYYDADLWLPPKMAGVLQRELAAPGRPDLRLFRMKHSNPAYTKYDVFRVSGVDPTAEPRQFQGGSLHFRNTRFARFLLGQWMRYLHDPRITTDAVSLTPWPAPGNESFIEHRHEQSVLTMLRAKYRIPFWSDYELYKAGFKHQMPDV